VTSTPVARLILVFVVMCGCVIALSSSAHFRHSIASGGAGKVGVAQSPTVTTIKDPLAVEPWSVEVSFSQEVLVTNYASDNLTIINRANNAIQNIPVGDGPGGIPDGPFGIADGLGTLYVTLFGSNTIPRKGVPVDYSNVGPGRVQLLGRESDGTYKPLTQIGVGKGPRFPAFLIGRCKLYVPCGGADRVDVIDTSTDRKIKEIPVGKDPSSCTISPDESKLYVTNFGDGTISVIDTKTDTKIKDIPAPRVVVGQAPVAQYPWTSAVSGSNGNLYVAYWGSTGGMGTDGAIVEIDTCTDDVIRVISDESTRGTPSGNPAATDSGGPIGIASCRPGVFFTNDGLGLVGLLDARTDRVISPAQSGLASRPKPRGIGSLLLQTGNSSNATFERIAYVACGAPDNELLVVRSPDLPEDIPNVPVIESFIYGSTIEIGGKGLMPGARVEAFLGGSPGCLTFAQEPKVKNGGTLLIQKGKLTNGRKLKPDVKEDDEDILFRVVNPNGAVRLVIVSGFRAVRACS
jgi:YVTN family beta-propeller protein